MRTLSIVHSTLLLALPIAYCLEAVAAPVNIGKYSGIYKIDGKDNAVFCPQKVVISKNSRTRLKISERMIFSFENKADSIADSGFNSGYVFVSKNKLMTSDDSIRLEVGDEEVCRDASHCKVDNIINQSIAKITLTNFSIRYSSFNVITNINEKSNLPEVSQYSAECTWRKLGGGR